jgi:nicotinamidase-related amidase
MRQQFVTIAIWACIAATLVAAAKAKPLPVVWVAIAHMTDGSVRPMFTGRDKAIVQDAAKQTPIDGWFVISPATRASAVVKGAK